MDVSGLTIGAITPAFGAFSSPAAPPSLAPSRAAGHTFVKDYRGLGVCFRCGSSAHKVKNCTKLVSTSGSGSGKRVTIAAVNDDDYGSDDNSEGYKLPPELD